MTDQNVKNENVESCSSKIGMQSSTVEPNVHENEDIKFEQLRLWIDKNLIGEVDGDQSEWKIHPWYAPRVI